MKGFALHDDTHLLVFRRTATEANKQLINKANAIFIDWKIWISRQMLGASVLPAACFCVIYLAVFHFIVAHGTDFVSVHEALQIYRWKRTTLQVCDFIRLTWLIHCCNISAMSSCWSLKHARWYVPKFCDDACTDEMSCSCACLNQLTIVYKLALVFKNKTGICNLSQWQCLHTCLSDTRFSGQSATYIYLPVGSFPYMAHPYCHLLCASYITPYCHGQVKMLHTSIWTWPSQ